MRLIELLGVLWCRRWHRGIMRGTDQYYRCGKFTCPHKFAYPWTPAKDVPAGVWSSN